MLAASSRLTEDQRNARMLARRGWLPVIDLVPVFGAIVDVAPVTHWTHPYLEYAWPFRDACRLEEDRENGDEVAMDLLGARRLTPLAPTPKQTTNAGASLGRDKRNRSN